MALGTSGASGVSSVRGFDGSTITVAGLGSASNFKGADIGTIARFKRANDTHEVKGVKFDYSEFADDKQDPAVATSEVRRLVTQTGIFAIVPDLSAVNPGPYLTQQKVPYLGFAFDPTYCSQKPSTALYGFSFTGCTVPANPPAMPDLYDLFYKNLQTKLGKPHPTLALISGDTASGKASAKYQATAFQGAGFKVVYAKGVVPLDASDYTPYVQQLLNSNGGQPPDAVACALTTQCIALWNLLQASGFKGAFYSPLGIDLLAKPLAGTYSLGFSNTQPTPALTQMKADFAAAGKPGTLPLYSDASYFAADMFVKAVKAVVAKTGVKALTPDAVQKFLSTQTWELKGVAGPIKYPASTVLSTPSCSELLNSSGTAPWDVIEPYSCSYKRFKVDPKFTGN
jgi:ABC-type branched-subunit amino acid transport system substrate-binding protein